MTGIPRSFLVAIAVAACLSAFATVAPTQDGAAQRKQMRERTMGNASKLAPPSIPARDANDCVGFYSQLSGWYAENHCEYRVNVTWCAIVATKVNACVDQSIAPRTLLRLSPFANVTKYRGLACYAPSRPTESSPDPTTGTRQLACSS